MTAAKKENKLTGKSIPPHFLSNKKSNLTSFDKDTSTYSTNKKNNKRVNKISSVSMGGME